MKWYRVQLMVEIPADYEGDIRNAPFHHQLDDAFNAIGEDPDLLDAYMSAGLVNEDEANKIFGN